eukprot:scaffold67992_cov32-Phaeocystis_antarctica.AAC.1
MCTITGPWRTETSRFASAAEGWLGLGLGSAAEGCERARTGRVQWGVHGACAMGRAMHVRAHLVVADDATEGEADLVRVK